jgi:hypothetical protein
MDDSAAAASASAADSCPFSCGMIVYDCVCDCV